MSVIQTTVTRPKPGRRHDAVAIAWKPRSCSSVTEV